MPGIVVHMSVAKKVGEKIGKNTPEFYRGNLLPDVLAGDKMNTHYKIQGKLFHIPDTDYYQKHFDLSDDYYLGYYVHLLLDRYFMDEFIPSITNDRDVFRKGIIYEDYDNSNEAIIQKYQLDIDQLISYLDFPNHFSIDKKRLEKNIHCLHVRGCNPMKCFSISELEEFIDQSVEKIVREIETR